ncbi:hypothetical protein RHGRI_024781 [Rhododendron griersonianum]|uniref:Uncharacterized protein n=1 Tax=Rhododendron griersonianum TaxID=479676 RepID=A0AAV6JC29_9ERIC|nr:hypothetical protein RHGRI_024781 [Rhododendron griersonianum]
MGDNDWVKLAMDDDSVVVDLLMCLHHSTPSPPKREKNSKALLPLEWRVRQRRSKPIPHPKAKKPTPTASPTTPLSWSGATSVSCGGDGLEESSQSPPKRPESTRSKVIAAGGTASNKKSRKKKTLPELKEEEILLLKERRQLKRELDTLRDTLEKQRATNESLKRLRLDLESQQAAERVTAIASFEGLADQRRQKLASCDPIPSVLQPDARIDDHDDELLLSPNGPSKLKQEIIDQEDKFLLPDLNIPVENSNSENNITFTTSQTESGSISSVGKGAEGDIEILTA